MHIFLTGEKQIGKSTLVSKVLGQVSMPVYGIRSISCFENGDRVVCLVPCRGNAPDPRIVGGVCRNHHVVEKHPEAFDSYGVSLLSDIPSGSLVVIDEVGNMERDATDYSSCILSLLERTDIKVLGVVQKMATTDLAMGIRENPNVKLIEVNIENRDSLIGELLGGLS